MYKKYFSFKCKPFELIPNPDFLYPSSTHKKAITYLDYGIKEKSGFILITGEIGSGKTTIIRNLIKNLNGTINVSKINNTKVTSEQLISMVNEDFGLDIKGKNKIDLLSDLNEFLIDQYSNKFQPVLLIDEAQNLSPDLLEEIRLLSNLETDRAKLLQIILIGQPELRRTLMMPEMMQLRQRININYHISPLTIDETEKYIKHRLNVAGNPHAINFQGDMINRIYKFSNGIPRLINILCDFALLTAFVEGEKEVNNEVVKQVIKDLEAYNYWTEAKDNTQSENNSKHDSSLLMNDSELALRLIRIEETVNRSLNEFSEIAEKVKGIEFEIESLKKKINQQPAIKY